jgi:hypothetical protein
VSDVSLNLSTDEALVLFELLHRWELAGQIDPVLLEGEQSVLWSVSAALERVLVEPFAPSYGALVAAARARLARASGV